MVSLVKRDLTLLDTPLDSITKQGLGLLLHLAVSTNQEIKQS